MREIFNLYCLFLFFALFSACKGDQLKGQVRIDAVEFDSHPKLIYEADSIITDNAPTRITRNIKIDNIGNLIIADYEAIIRYDGNAFSNITKGLGLDIFYAFDVLEDRKGNLWIVSDQKGIYRIDAKTKKLRHFTTEDGLGHARNMCILEDKAGTIWVGGQGGLSRFDGNSFRTYTTAEGLTDNDISSMMEDKNGNIWLGTRGDACYFDGSVFHRITTDEGSPLIIVNTLLQDRTGNIWLGGIEGLWRYDGSSYQLISKNRLGDVYEDKQGNIWMTSDTWAEKDLPNSSRWMLSRFNANDLQNDHFELQRIYTDGGMFFGISEDQTGAIWVGTLNGVFRYDGKAINYYKNNQNNK